MQRKLERDLQRKEVLRKQRLEYEKSRKEIIKQKLTSYSPTKYIKKVMEKRESQKAQSSEGEEVQIHSLGGKHSRHVASMKHIPKDMLHLNNETILDVESVTHRTRSPKKAHKLPNKKQQIFLQA
jgi:ABC-type sulfate transport system substrate-binding protein